MHATTTISPTESYSSSRPALVFIAIALAVGVVYAGHELFLDLSSIRLGVQLPYVLLGIALLIALGFEFVNGFHDTANAVATVIYTHSLPPYAAVVWSGVWNFLGVLFSSGAVAFGIIALLPVELILQWERCWLRRDVCALNRGDALESGNMVSGLTCFELTYPDWVHCWSRLCQSAYAARQCDQRCRMGSGHQGRLLSALVAPDRLFRCGLAVGGHEDPHKKSSLVPGSGRPATTSAVDSES